MTKFLTAEEKAEELNVSVETLRRWRREGRGPDFIRHASVVRYYPEPTREETRASS